MANSMTKKNKISTRRSNSKVSAVVAKQSVVTKQLSKKRKVSVVDKQQPSPPKKKLKNGKRALLAAKRNNRKVSKDNGVEPPKKKVKKATRRSKSESDLQTELDQYFQVNEDNELREAYNEYERAMSFFRYHWHDQTRKSTTIKLILNFNEEEEVIKHYKDILEKNKNLAIIYKRVLHLKAAIRKKKHQNAERSYCGYENHECLPSRQLPEPTATNEESVFNASERTHDESAPKQHSKQQCSWFNWLNFRRPWWKSSPKKLDDVEGFRLISLPKGTSNCLQRLVRKHVKGVKEQDIFSCDPGTHKSLSRPQRNKFTRLKGTEDSFTDRKRKLQNICQDDFNKEEVVAKILSILRDNLDVTDYIIEEPVLLTTEESTDTIFRQQLHRDFHNDSKSMFVIIPLCHDQTIYYEKNEGISSIKLSKDVAFVGHSQLIHAGSEQPGKRLHFKLVEEGQVEDTKTYFVEDSLYPGISGILKFK